MPGSPPRTAVKQAGSAGAAAAAMQRGGEPKAAHDSPSAVAQLPDAPAVGQVTTDNAATGRVPPDDLCCPLTLINHTVVM